MKRIIALILAVLMSMALFVGCGGDEAFYTESGY